MNIFKKAIEEAKALDTALTEYEAPEFQPTAQSRPKTMYGLKLFIPFEDLNTYIQNNINEPYQNHTFIPIKAEINDVGLSLDITLLSANAIETKGRYRLDLNKLLKEGTK